MLKQLQNRKINMTKNRDPLPPICDCALLMPHRILVGKYGFDFVLCEFMNSTWVTNNTLPVEKPWELSIRQTQDRTFNANKHHKINRTREMD